MSSAFVSLPPAGPAAPPAAPDAVAGDGFYPALSLAAVRSAVRVETSITDQRLRDATLAAMSEVQDELAAWRAVQDLAGFGQLADCSARQLGGENRLAVLYRRAVHALVKADLDEGARGPDTTPRGSDRADLLDTTLDEQRRNARWAIADLIGRPRTTVELI